MNSLVDSEFSTALRDRWPRQDVRARFSSRTFDELWLWDSDHHRLGSLMELHRALGRDTLEYYRSLLTVHLYREASGKLVARVRKPADA